MRLINKKSSSVLGLDIGSNTIKAVGLGFDSKGIKLLGYGTAATPKECFDLDQLKNPGLLVSSIGTLLGSPTYGELAATQLEIALPHQVTRSKIIRLPKNGSKKDIARLASSFKNSADVDFDIYSHKISQSQKKNNYDNIYSVRGLIKNTRKNLNKELSQIGLRARSFSSQVDGLSRVLAGHSAGQATWLLDIGEESSRLYLLGQYGLMHDQYPIGAQKIISTISKGFGISTHEATLLSNKTGLYRGSLGQKILSLLRPSLDALSDRINISINKYSDSVEAINAKKFITTGTIASMPGLSQYMSRNISVPIEVIEPWSNINSYPLKPMPKRLDPSYASAIGLAMSAGPKVT
ncbi:MAG: pilus assembly protein PilM [Patescibacteria group bacterium]|nr:pilus assembly protein PilM [Patescibacteria group bacterium]